MVGIWIKNSERKGKKIRQFPINRRKNSESILGYNIEGEKMERKKRKKRGNFIHRIVHRHNHQNPHHRARLASWQLDKRHHSPYVQVQDVRIDVIDVAEKWRREREKKRYILNLYLFRTMRFRVTRFWSRFSPKGGKEERKRNPPGRRWKCLQTKFLVPSWAERVWLDGGRAYELGWHGPAQRLPMLAPVRVLFALERQPETVFQRFYDNGFFSPS